MSNLNKDKVDHCNESASFRLSSAGNITGTVTINHSLCGGGNSTSFTALFSGIYPQLRTVAYGGQATNSSGYDILFTADLLGTELLTWEIESYNPVSGEIAAWVLIPTLSASINTVFYVQVGFSGITTFQGGVVGSAWAEYQTVMHFENGTSLSLADSSGNGNTGIISGSVTATAGVIDGGAVLGSGNITTPVAPASTVGSIELWALIGASSGNEALIGTYSYETPPYAPVLYAFGIGIKSIGYSFGIDVNPGGIWTPIVWQLFCLTWNNSTGIVNLFVSGVLLSSITYHTPAPFSTIRLGGTTNSEQGPWSGYVDELRTSNVARDINWNIARYNNESSPSTFYSVSFTLISLSIACASPPSGTVGVVYTHTFPVTGGTSPYTFSITSGSLPTGITLNSSTGVVSGTPTTPGSFSFTIQVTDSLSAIASVPCSITIIGGVSISCASPPAGTVGVSYSHTFPVSGGIPPYTFSIVTGSLPTGLTLNISTGVVSGTPTTLGTSSFGIKVTDSVSNNATVNCSISIFNPALSVNCGSPATGYVGIFYTSHPSAIGGVSPYTFSVVSGAIPPGLTINSSTGLISGTPSKVGSYSYRIQVTDSVGATGFCNVTALIIAVSFGGLPCS